jgi:hypothetical protein
LGLVGGGEDGTLRAALPGPSIRRHRRSARPSVHLSGWKRFIAVLLAAVYGFFAARFLFELFRWAHTRCLPAWLAWCVSGPPRENPFSAEAHFLPFQPAVRANGRSHTDRESDGHQRREGERKDDEAARMRVTPRTLRSNATMRRPSPKHQEHRATRRTSASSPSYNEAVVTSSQRREYTGSSWPRAQMS